MTGEFLAHGGKVGGYLSEGLEGMEGEADSRRAQRLFLGVVRNLPVLEAAVLGRVEKPPRRKLLALLLVATFEMLEAGPERIPRVVDHAVRVARQELSGGESRLVNALLRRIVREGGLEFPLPATHPVWLVRRWEKAFGREAMLELLKWNQRAAVAYLHDPGLRPRPDGRLPMGILPTRWPGFWEVEAAGRTYAMARVQAGAAYFQDPFTVHPVDLLDPRPGERILDACAAPGGKSWQIAQRMGTDGWLVAVDRPGARLTQLESNLSRIGGVRVQALGADLEQEGALRGVSPEGGFDGVLIDVPCSNTGVIQRRPDVKLRLTEAAIGEQSERQLALLRAVAGEVRPGGRLVYSTCSLEAEENTRVVERFLAEDGRFLLNEHRASLPWKDGHDGGAAFLLHRTK